MDSRQIAKNNLLHYFELFFKEHNIKMDSDNYSEISDIVEIIYSDFDIKMRGLQNSIDDICRRLECLHDEGLSKKR